MAGSIYLRVPENVIILYFTASSKGRRLSSAIQHSANLNINTT